MAFPAAAARFEKVRIWETKNNIFEEAAPVVDGAAAVDPHPAFASLHLAKRKVPVA
jgi:hypothetical protein